MKRVILLGKGELAVRIADWFLKSNDYNLEIVVPVIPEPTWAVSLLSWCNGNNVKVVSSGDYLEVLNVGLEDFLVISVFYDKIIKKEFIKKCSKILNLHNGPLPRYRGVRPINWALKNGEIEHGVTIHEITPGIDDGPIIAQIKYSIYPEFDEVMPVYKRALEYGWILFQQTIPILNLIKSRKQDETAATYYSNKDMRNLGKYE